MNTLECIRTRRSRRLFLDKEVADEDIKIIINAALTAPSSMDCQPWQFVIVKNKEIKQKLAGLKEEDNQQHIQTAPMCIVLCVDKEKSPSRYMEDGVTAAQNLLLAAHDLGLGCIYVTGCKDKNPEVGKKICEILDLPETIVPITIMPLGYPNPEEKLEEKTLLKADDVMHEDKW